MQVGRESHTALITTFSRAYHTRYSECPMFRDEFAEVMLAPGAYDFLSTSMAQLLSLYDPDAAAASPDRDTALAAVMRLTGWTALVRDRYTEECLTRAAEASDIGQYLILGAGLDTFAFRRPESLSRLRVFELDRPQTQGFKLKRIAELGWPLPQRTHYLPIDFTTQQIDEVLGAGGYDPAVAAFVSWLGVTYYLPRPVVLATLRVLAKVLAPGSTVVFDYFDHDALSSDRASRYLRRMRELVARLGEPLLTTFDPVTLAEDLAETGLTVAENLGPADIQARYFAGRPDGVVAPDHLHLARLTMAGRPTATVTGPVA